MCVIIVFMVSLPEEIVTFMDVFAKSNYQIYVVGGAVRDLLIGKTTLNWDFTTSAKPEEILKLFPDGFYNNQFGTVGIPKKFNDQNVVFEVTTFRKESDYSDKRRPENVEWAKTIEEDLARRDFTINAIACDGKKLTDPFQGQEHIKQKLVIAVGDPQVRFQEDALRLMRAVRLCTELGFVIDQKTHEAVKQNAHLITHVSWERIRDELFRIIMSDNAADGILLLKETTLLKYILPEVDVCFEVQQVSPKRHHIYDVGTHLVMSLKHCPSKDVITRFATLLHDIGKAETYRKDEETKIITFYNHEVVGEKQVGEIAKRFKLSNKDSHKLITLVRSHQFTVSEIQTDKAVRRFIRQVGKEYLQDILDLRTGDRVGSGSTPTSWRLDLFKKRLEEVQKQPFSVTDLKIDGTDVMKTLDLKPGPEVGKILNALFDEVINGKVKNEKSSLLEVLPRLRDQNT